MAVVEVVEVAVAAVTGRVVAVEAVWPPDCLHRRAQVPILTRPPAAGILKRGIEALGRY